MQLSSDNLFSFSQHLSEYCLNYLKLFLSLLLSSLTITRNIRSVLPSGIALISFYHLLFKDYHLYFIKRLYTHKEVIPSVSNSFILEGFVELSKVWERTVSVKITHLSQVPNCPNLNSTLLS
jgi:hypothetical protein